MRTHSTLTKSAVVAIAMAAAFTLSGCFANPIDQLTDKIGSEIAEGGAEKLVEGMTGGELDIEAGSLPKDFPAELPVVDGEILSSMGIGVENGKSWTVTIKVDDSLAALATAREQIVSAGFEETLWNDAQGMTMGSFTNDTYIVTISGMFSDGDEQVVSYTVLEATE